jgi:tagatose-1,6-bisphosphate aldolase
MSRPSSTGGGGFDMLREKVQVSTEVGCAGLGAGRALWGEWALADEAHRPSVIAETVLPRWERLRAVTSVA